MGCGQIDGSGALNTPLDSTWEDSGGAVCDATKAIRDGFVISSGPPQEGMMVYLDEAEAILLEYIMINFANKILTGICYSSLRKVFPESCICGRHR